MIMFLLNNNNNDDNNGRRPIHWGGTMIAFGLVLLFGILMVYLVSTADFGQAPTTSVPRTPGPCAPFCPTTP
ncbi:hypothetical protein [Nocardia altamirensis]|uniref:hypothetical protein n=1 Tax=Nocardia altamirensis TaxID=472158 RepID=UPI0008402F56|nr:hypothetical protein [Nocardia altamirensis]